MSSGYRKLFAACLGAAVLALTGTGVTAHAAQHIAPGIGDPPTGHAAAADPETAAPSTATPSDGTGDDGGEFGLKATLYVTTDQSSGRDSVGCTVIPMRTVAVDGKIVTRHTILFIKETVGLRMPDGTVHDGYWYATDVGGAIHAGRIDLYTGKGYHTITPLLHLNLKTLTVKRAGQFAGCPGRDGATAITQASTAAQAIQPAGVEG